MITLTDEGRALIDRVTEAHLANEARLLDGLSSAASASGSPACCASSRSRCRRAERSGHVGRSERAGCPERPAGDVDSAAR